MMFAKKEKIWLLVTVIFAAWLTRYTLTYQVVYPWRALGTLAGDSAKNSFAYIYQCIYGHGFHFDGMNYPYGDNIVFADGQAALSVPFSLIKGESVGLVLTTLWWLIGLSYILGMVFLYKILLRFKVHPPIAAVFACLIGIFTPQLARVGGHFGLSYTCVIPMLFYWTLRYNEQPQWKYGIYIFSLGLFATFLHPYFSAVVLVWVLSYAAGYLLFTREPFTVKLKNLLPIGVSVVAMLATVALIMKIADPVKDRPATPYGLLSYITRPEDIYTSSTSPIWQYLSEHNMFTKLYPRISSGGEGYTYLGMAVMAIVLYSLLAGVYALLAKKKEKLVLTQEVFSPIWMFMAIGALLFAMSVPYMWHTDWLLEHLSFMRQFRSLGRFSWIFYYIITVYAVVVLARRFTALRMAGRTFDAIAIVVLCACLWGYEAEGSIQNVRKLTKTSLYSYDQFFNPDGNGWRKFLSEHNHKAEDYQAVVMLSYFHTGSDKLWLGECGGNLPHCVIASLQLHLPTVNALMARTSWSQTFKQAKTFAGPYAAKPMLADLPNNKPLLLLKYDNHVLDPDQQYLLQACDYVGHFSKCEIYSFYPDRLRANDRLHADSINAVLPSLGTGDTCLTNTGAWTALHFDDGAGGQRFFGPGALGSITGHDSILAILPIRPQHDSQIYELSCWFLLGDKDPNAPYIIVQSLDSAGTQLRSDDLLVKASMDIEGMWFRGAVHFAVRSDCSAIRCQVVSDVKRSYLALDELLLRPAGSVIISKAADGSVLVNNHLFKKKGGAK